MCAERMIHGKVGALFETEIWRDPLGGEEKDVCGTRGCGDHVGPLRDPSGSQGTREAGGVISGTMALGAEPRTLGKNGTATFTGLREWTIRPPPRSL